MSENLENELQETSLDCPTYQRTGTIGDIIDFIKSDDWVMALGLLKTSGQRIHLVTTEEPRADLEYHLTSEGVIISFAHGGEVIERPIVEASGQFKYEELLIVTTAFLSQNKEVLLIDHICEKLAEIADNYL